MKKSKLKTGDKVKIIKPVTAFIVSKSKNEVEDKEVGKIGVVKDIINQGYFICYKVELDNSKFLLCYKEEFKKQRKTIKELIQVYAKAISVFKKEKYETDIFYDSYTVLPRRSNYYEKVEGINYFRISSKYKLFKWFYSVHYYGKFLDYPTQIENSFIYETKTLSKKIKLFGGLINFE